MTVPGQPSLATWQQENIAFSRLSSDTVLVKYRNLECGEAELLSERGLEAGLVPLAGGPGQEGDQAGSQQAGAAQQTWPAGPAHITNC